MTDDDEELMERYGITCEHNTVYYYMGYKYERLRDALNFAKNDSEARVKVKPTQ